MGSVHSSGAEEAAAAASARPGGFWEQQAAAERRRRRHRQQQQEVEVELQEAGLQRRRQLIPRARLASGWAARRHRHQHQGWPEVEEWRGYADWGGRSRSASGRDTPGSSGSGGGGGGGGGGTFRVLGRRLSWQPQPQRRHRSVGDLSAPCRSLPLDAGLAGGGGGGAVWRSELQLHTQPLPQPPTPPTPPPAQPRRARAKRLHRQFALYQVTPPDNNFDYLRRFHSSGEVASLGGVDEAQLPPADDCSATSVSTCSGSAGCDWGAAKAAARGQAGSRASSSSSAGSSGAAAGLYRLRDSDSDGEQQDAAGHYLTVCQNLEPDSESEAELVVTSEAEEAEEEEEEEEEEEDAVEEEEEAEIVAAVGDAVVAESGAGCCTLTRSKSTSSGPAAPADSSGGGPQQETPADMSRRPQVLRVTDSANSVLTSRKSPTSPPPPPAVVATLATCTAAVATPPLDAKAVCVHADAGADSYRAVAAQPLGPEPVDEALDGLARYLQAHRQGLRDLLLSSGLVVVQPLPAAAAARSCRIAGATVKAPPAAAQGPPHTAAAAAADRAKSYTIPRALRFFHPKRHNRELLDEELPDPDTVRRARQVFEASLAAAAPAAPAPPAAAPARRALSAPGRRWTDCGSVSSGVSSDLSSSYEARSSRGSDDSDRGSADDDDEDEDDAGRGGSPTGEARVSGEVLERIRARGLSVTYYGGRVVASTPAPPPVAAVLSEIRGGGGGGGFRLVKSHSCGSRLQLAAGAAEGEGERDRPVFTSRLGDVALRQDRQLAAYCCAGRDLPPARRCPDMEFEEFQVLDDGQGAVCGAA